MSVFLVLAYLFYIGSISGWFIELLFRRFISSKNPERKWINPGFCVGPYIPLYGFGLCALYAMTYIDENLVPDTWWGFVVMIVMMSVTMTVIELLAGLLVLKISNIRLWDYSDKWGNYKGLICPQFSLIWAACAVAYYFLLHPIMIDKIIWLSQNLAFSFVIGLFFGVFIIDVVYSANLLVKIRKYAVDHDIIVRFEELKTNIHAKKTAAQEKVNFLLPFQDVKNEIGNYVDHAKESVDKKVSDVKKSKKKKGKKTK